MSGKAKRHGAVDSVSTRIIGQRTLTVDGVPVQWWAVGDQPALVTVRTAAFGSLAEFTRHDVAEFALTLARKLLAKHLKRPSKAAAKSRTTMRTDASPLEKPGWFDPNADFGKTRH